MDFLPSCEQLHDITRIPMGIVSSDGNYLHGFPGLLQGIVNARFVQIVLMDFQLQNRDPLHPLITYVEPGYLLGVSQLEDGLYCLVGLVSPFRHTRDEILHLAAGVIDSREMHAYCDMMMQVPLVNLYQLKALMSLVTKLAHETAIADEDILFVSGDYVYYSNSTSIGRVTFIENNGEYKNETLVTMTRIVSGEYAFVDGYIYFYAQYEPVEVEEGEDAVEYETDESKYMYRIQAGSPEHISPYQLIGKNKVMPVVEEDSEEATDTTEE